MPTPKAPNRLERHEAKINTLRAKLAAVHNELQAAYAELRTAEKSDGAQARIAQRGWGDQIEQLRRQADSLSGEIITLEQLRPVLQSQGEKLKKRLAELESDVALLTSIRPQLKFVAEAWPGIHAKLSPVVQRETYSQAQGVAALLQTLTALQAQLTEATEEHARWENG